MDRPVPARLSRRTFLASLGVAAAGGAATALLATEFAHTAGRAEPAASGASPGASLAPSSPQPSPDYSAVRNHYRSRPDLTPSQMLVQVPAGAVAPGFLFVTPSNGSGTDGPAIFTDEGDLVWLRPDSGTQVANFQIVMFAGRPTLACWEGIVNGGIGTGDVILVDDTYREVSRVHAGNGRRADLHEFQLSSTMPRAPSRPGPSSCSWTKWR